MPIKVIAEPHRGLVLCGKIFFLGDISFCFEFRQKFVGDFTAFFFLFANIQNVQKLLFEVDVCVEVKWFVVLGNLVVV
jgi:hypothetical protein